MTIIKQYKKGKYNLTQSEIIDYMGLKRNFVQIQVNQENGSKINYPVHSILRVSNLKRDELYAGENTEPFTDEECETIIKNFRLYN